MSDAQAGAQQSGLATFKRPYKKSTRGCNACKARKIKCNEVHPICGQCSLRFKDITSCDYSSSLKKCRKVADVSSRPSSLQLLPRGAQLQRPVSFTPAGINFSKSSHLLELRLMHHYTRVTCGQTSQRATSNPTWEIDVPRLAFSSESVLNALLGISALHLTGVTQYDPVLCRASSFYIAKAARSHRSALNHIDAGNAEPLLLTAVLIAHHTWMSSLIYDGPYKFDLQIYHMCRGIEALALKTACFTGKQDWQLKAQDEYTKTPSGHNGFMASALHDLAALSKSFHGDGISFEDQKTFEKSAEELITTYTMAARASSEGSLMETKTISFLKRVPPRFLELVELDDPLAMAMLARNVAMLELLEDSNAWWIHGVGEWKVAPKTVWAIRERMPPEWLWAMEWPLKVIAREVRLDLDEPSGELKDFMPNSVTEWTEMPVVLSQAL